MADHAEITEHLTLINLGEGGAEEKFQREVRRVLENIQDPNTDHKATRSIAMTVSFNTNENRTSASLSISFKTKLAQEEGVSSQIFIAKNNQGHVEAITFNPDQLSIFDKTVTLETNVVNFNQ